MRLQCITSQVKRKKNILVAADWSMCKHEQKKYEVEKDLYEYR